jgi:ADP-heptose:LPS heptosyltransferase
MNTIAVIRLGRLGDVALTGPTVKNLHFRYPGSKVLFITRARYAPLAAALPGVDRVLTFPDNGNYLDLVRLSSAIEECRPDLVVDLHKNFRSFHLATLTKAPYRVVYRKRRKERLAAVDDKKFVSPIPHTCDLYNGVVGQLNGTVLARRPDLMLTEAVLQRMLRDGVAIVPGASFPVKAWPANRFAQLAERIISDFQLTVRVFLGEDEGDLQHAFAHLPRGNLEIHHNRPLAELTGELSRQQLTISNDSGLMHVSSAVGTPTAALFGPTHEQLGFYPWGFLTG